MRNYIQPGHAITLAAPYDVVSGAGLLVGSIFGVASARRALRRRGRDPAHRRHRPRQGREPGLDRRRQGLLGQHREAGDQRRLGQHAHRRGGARRRRRRRRDRRPGAAQRHLLSDDRLRRPRRPAVRRSEPRAGRDLRAGGRGAGLRPRGRPAGRRRSPSSAARGSGRRRRGSTSASPRWRTRGRATGSSSTARPSSCRASRCGIASGWSGRST